MNFLFEQLDNSKLILFRIFFGLLMMVECWGAIATGWVSRVFVEPSFTFNFIGFNWTQVFLGTPMYWLYAIMGFLGLLIMIGAAYRTSIVLFFILWSLSYFMQKTSYNNHYYLIMLVSFLMIWMPANKYMAVDARMVRGVTSTGVSRWMYLLFQILIACVYIFAAIAKISPGWMNDHFLPIRLEYSAQWFESKFDENLFSNFLRSPDLSPFLAYAGFAFDLLIIPLLIFKPTRKVAFVLAVLFHLFNSITLHIGIFPYFALALCIFFFDSEEIRRWFLPFKTRNVISEREYISPLRRMTVFYSMVAFTALMIYLPVRHWFIKDDVLWTEEGHRMAWRMMLRTKQGTGHFEVQTADGQTQQVMLTDHLSQKQMGAIHTKPDLIWQFAQKLRKDYAAQGQDSIQVFYRNSHVQVNGGPFHPFIDPNADLANTKWSYFGHQDWILPSPVDYYSESTENTIR